VSWFRRSSRSGQDSAPDETAADETAADETAADETVADDTAAEEPAAGETDTEDAAADEMEDVDASREAAEAAEAERSRLGPFDVSEVDDDIVRVDLGALRIPPREGMELRLELEEQTQRVIAATITLAGSSVQMQPFAAPRTEGVWEDIRAEIAQQVTRQGGTADELAGRLGRELLARIPARTPDGRTGHQVVRFTGIDGPRWFLRAVFNGRAAVDEDAAADLEQVVRGTVVVRGSEAMAPRDLLPLQVPAGPAQAPEATGNEPGEPSGTQNGAGDLGPPDPFRRGPEITEIH
jgi:Protein of unknown function (DUF3710)